LADPIENLTHANEETFLLLQIEDKEAIDEVDEIAAVEGVDLLFVGPGDLTISYGVPMQMDHPDVQRAYDRVANAAAKHGKWWGTTSATPEAAQKVLDRGGRMITCGGDHPYLLNDSRPRRGILKARRLPLMSFALYSDTRPLANARGSERINASPSRDRQGAVRRAVTRLREAH